MGFFCLFSLLRILSNNKISVVRNHSFGGLRALEKLWVLSSSSSSHDKLWSKCLTPADVDAAVINKTHRESTLMRKKVFFQIISASSFRTLFMPVRFVFHCNSETWTNVRRKKNQSVISMKKHKWDLFNISVIFISHIKWKLMFVWHHHAVRLQ